jgi:hypothetical protein
MSEEVKTAKELTEKTEQQVMLDGFDTYTDEVEGEDDSSLDSRLLRGTRIKFTNEYTWTTMAGDEISSNEEFIVDDIVRVEAKWSKDKNAPPYTRVVPPGEKFRSMKKLNEESPKSEWIEGPNGQPKGPWEIQRYVYLLDRLMKKYTYVTSTIGGGIAVSQLVEQVKDAREVYGPGVYAKVRLSDTWMKTRYSKEGRQRPHFIVTGYARKFGGGSKPAELPNLTETVKLEKPVGEHLDKPTAKQVLNDEIRF